MPKKEKLPKQKKPPKQAKHVKQQKKRKGRSVQDFIGIEQLDKISTGLAFLPSVDLGINIRINLL